MMLEIIGTENCLGILSFMVGVLFLSFRMLNIDIKELTDKSSYKPKKIFLKSNLHIIFSLIDL